MRPAPRPPITTDVEASSIGDLTGEWKIVARSTVTGWDWCGHFNDGAEQNALQRMVWPAGKSAVPHVSMTTGRHYNGVFVLYARMYPVALRRAA